MTIADKTVLVTGANRGIGQALVEEALSRGAKRVYAGARQPLTHPDGRVTPLTLDVTNAAQIQASRREVDSLDILINNAGVALYDDLSDRAVLEQHLAVNLFGTVRRDPGFPAVADCVLGEPSSTTCRRTAFAPLPLIPAYSISKAAAFNLTQSLRVSLGRTGRARSCRPDRPRGHRYDPRPRHTEGLSGVRCASHLRRSGERGGGDLPRSDVGVHGGELAQRCGQGARAPVRGAPRRRARRGMTSGSAKRLRTPSAQFVDRPTSIQAGKCTRTERQKSQ